MENFKKAIINNVLDESVKSSHSFQKNTAYSTGNDVFKFLERKGKIGVFLNTKTNKKIEKEILVMPALGSAPAEEYIKLTDTVWIKAWFNKISDKKSYYSDEKHMYSGKSYKYVN